MRPDQFLLKTVPVFWTQELDKEFAMIAMDSYPNEACAYIIKNKLVPVNNISETPDRNFELSLEDSLLQFKASGFIHSHPNGPFWPSGADMISQKSCKVPFGIVTCTKDSCSTSIWLHDNNLSIQLEERPFIHGIFDCYSLIRAYYKQAQNLVIPDFPRDMSWWEKDKNGNHPDLYMRNFELAGFKEIDKDDQMQIGDGILMSIQTNVVSHAAVYIGDGLLLHHLRGKISKKDSATAWRKFYTKIVRYGN